MPQPIEHYIGRLCEEFHCLPSEAWEELMRVPVGTLEQVIEYRAFAAAFWARRHQQNPKEKSEMWQMVERIEHELAAEELGIEFKA